MSTIAAPLTENRKLQIQKWIIEIASDANDSGISLHKIKSFLDGKEAEISRNPEVIDIIHSLLKSGKLSNGSTNRRYKVQINEKKTNIKRCQSKTNNPLTGESSKSAMKREMKTLPDSPASKTIAKKVKRQKNDSQEQRNSNDTMPVFNQKKQPQLKAPSPKHNLNGLEPNDSEECVASCSYSTKNSGKSHLNQPKQAIVPIVMDFSFLTNRSSYLKMIKNSSEQELSDLTTLAFDSEHGTKTGAAGPSGIKPVKLSRKSLPQHTVTCRASLTPKISSRRQDVKPNKNEKNKTNQAVKVKRSSEARKSVTKSVSKKSVTKSVKKSVTKSAKRKLKSADAPKSKLPRKTKKGKKAPQKISKKIRPPKKDCCWYCDLTIKANLKEKPSPTKVSSQSSPLKDTYNKPSTSKSENYESTTQKHTTTNFEPTEQETGSIKRLNELKNHTQMEIDDDTSGAFCSESSQSIEQMDEYTMHTVIKMEKNDDLKASTSKSSESTEELNEIIKMDVEDHEPKSASLKGPDSNKLLDSQLIEVEIKHDELRASSSNASSSSSQVEIDDDTSMDDTSTSSQSIEQMESTEDLNEIIKLDVEDHEPKSARLKGPDSNKLLDSQLIEVEIKHDELRASSSNASSSNAQVEIKDGEIYPSCSESVDLITKLEESN